MHPHLHTKDNVGCAQVMEMLEDCHSNGFFNKMFGQCNEIKRQVDKCLRAERLQRQANNRALAREKRAQIERVWRDIDEQS